MLLPLNLDNQLIVASPGSTSPMAAISGKRGKAITIAVPVIQAGTAALAAITGLELRLVIKLPSQYELSPLIPYPTFAWSSDRLQYEAPTSFITSYLNGLFGVESDAVTISGGDATSNVITTSTAHGLAVNDRVWFPALTGGTGLTAAEGTWYYVLTAPSTTTFTVSATQGGATLDFTTTITAGSVRKDPVDVDSITLAIELGWRISPATDWTSSENNVALTLYNNYLRDTDGTPADVSASTALSWLGDHAVRYEAVQALSQLQRIQVLDNTQPALTTLTGGTAGCLDSIITASSAVTTGRWVAVIVSGEFSIWQLQAGTTAEDSANGIVRPDDYNGSTNARIWIKIL